MEFSRRDLSLLLPALAAAGAAAQKAALPSKTYRYDDLPVRTSGPNRFRAILEGETHAGFATSCTKRNWLRAERRIRRIIMSTKSCS